MVKKIKNWILVQQIFAFKFYIPKNPDARAINSNLKPRFERHALQPAKLGARYDSQLDCAAAFAVAGAPNFLGLAKTSICSQTKQCQTVR